MLHSRGHVGDRGPCHPGEKTRVLRGCSDALCAQPDREATGHRVVCPSIVFIHDRIFEAKHSPIEARSST